MRVRDCVGYKDITPGTYDIGFIDDVGRDDETEFDVKDLDELVECWEDFCKENGFRYDSVTYVERAGE